MYANFRFNLYVMAAVVTFMIALQGFQPVQARTSNLESPQASGTTWYVTTTGDDANSCMNPTSPCNTIKTALDKAANGDSIQVAGGTYTSSFGEEVVLIRKSITLSGGWNADYSAQDEISIIDGQGLRRGITVSNNTVIIDNFIIQHGGNINNGGGIFNRGLLTINHSTIRENVIGQAYPSGYEGGGGIQNWAGSVILNNSKIIENTILDGSYGSGIYTSGGSFTVNNTAINNNKGDVAIFATSNGTLILNNSTVSGHDEGGIENQWGSVVLNNSTVTRNTGPYSIGGVSMYDGYGGTITLNNSILAGNKAYGLYGDCWGTIISAGYNIIGNNSGCTITPGPGDTIGTAAKPIDPLISAIPMEPGGFHALFLGSPAINTANPATCPATDQRGLLRPQGAGCDIGAYEYGAIAGPATFFEQYEGSNQQSYQGRAFAKRLTVYTVDNQGNPISGVNVMFTAPSAGTSGIFADTNSNTTTVLTDVNGLAIAPPFRANYETGAYMVTASTPDLTNLVSFSLTNLQIVPNYLQNGNFEDHSSLGNHWWQYSQNFGTPLCTFLLCGNRNGTTGPHSGTMWVWFDGVSAPHVETAAITQNITIPSGPAPVHLRFYLWISGTGHNGNNSEMTATVDASSTPIFTAKANQQALYSSYRLVDIDLSQYADNATHSILFRGITGNGVSFNLDDVSVNVATFGDVPPDHWAGQYIDRLFNASVTSGCSSNPTIYCPDSYVTRAQMAVFILRAKHGYSYNPPAATGTMFTDVPANYWAADWIEQLAREGITSGCGSGYYCPENTVSRDQMAVFLLRGKYGTTYNPPNAGGIMFSDVPVDYWAGAWIEQLATEGITSGCSNNKYCPTTPVSRAQMAIFLVKAFELP